VKQRPTPACSKARFDGYSITFTIDVGSAKIPCAISLAAFDLVSGDRRRQRAQLLSAFQTHDERISRIAHDLFLRRPESVDGTIRIWENDVEDDQDNGL
jgi:hypothetical protein